MYIRERWSHWIDELKDDRTDISIEKVENGYIANIDGDKYVFTKKQSMVKFIESRINKLD